MRSSWPTSSPIRAQGIPPRCRSETRRWRKSWGENEGTPAAVQARASACGSARRRSLGRQVARERDLHAPRAPLQCRRARPGPEPTGPALSSPRRWRCAQRCRGSSTSPQVSASSSPMRIPVRNAQRYMSRTTPAKRRGPALDLTTGQPATTRQPACRLRPRRSRRSQQSRP
jgi:hypothetical protein